MPAVEAKVQIRAPLELVWEMATKEQGLMAWVHPLQEVEAGPSCRWPSEGTRFRYRVRLMGAEAGGSGEIVEDSRGVLAAQLEVDGSPDRYLWRCHIYRRGASTIVEVHGEYAYEPFASIVPDRLTCHALLVRHAQLSLETLRVLVEGRQTIRSLAAG